MVAPIVITILAYLHIISAMGWLGGAVLFVLAVAPGLRALSPTARLEFLSKVGPRAVRFFIGSSTPPIAFGLTPPFFFPRAFSTTQIPGFPLRFNFYFDA